MKKGLSLILTAVFLAAMLTAGGISALAAGDVGPEDAKSVLNFTYLTKDKVLAPADGVFGYQDSGVDNEKLTLSYVTDDNQDWLKFVKTTNQPNGLLLDLNKAKSQTPTKGITDWTGASMVWFYMKTDGRAILDFQVQVTEEGGATGYFSSKNANVKYYYKDEHGFVPKTLANDTQDWGHMDLNGYEGWIGVELANFGCGSGHLKNQTLTGNLGNVTGVGFYSELGTVYIRDIRVTGVAKGLEDLNKPSVPADVSPENAKPVADFAYLPENRELTLADGIGGLDDSAVTSKDLVVSMSKADGKAWLNYKRNNTNWNAGIYVDLLNAAAKGKAVTDWTGAETFWFYARTEAETLINIVAAVDNAYSGEIQGYFHSEAAGLKYYVEEDGAFVEKATTAETWKHMLLPADYDGWVGFDLSQLVCRSGHLAEQDFEAHLGDVYGIGFYMEGGPLAVTDFRADGIVRGLEEGQGGGSSTVSDNGGSGSSGTGSDAPNTGVPFVALPAALLLAAAGGMLLAVRKSR